MISLYPETPGHKGGETSRQAAEKIAKAAELTREQCLNLLQQTDLTPDEIAEMTGKDVHDVRSRCSELSAEELIFETGVKRKNKNGNPCKVWSAHRPETK